MHFQASVLYSPVKINDELNRVRLNVNIMLREITRLPQLIEGYAIFLVITVRLFGLLSD